MPTRLLDGYRGYVMTDDYAGYNALAAQDGVERLGCGAHARRPFVIGRKNGFSDTPRAQLYSSVETAKAKANGEERLRSAAAVELHA